MKTIARIAISVAALALGSRELKAQAGPYQYVPLTPCRIIDTRYSSQNGNGSPSLTTAARNFTVRGLCGVPTSAKAVSLNLTVVSASMTSWLTVWPSDQAQPFVSVLNYDGTTAAIANGAIIGLGTAAQDLSIRNAQGSCNVIVDVTGYYQ